jgi:hypothetical protein
VVFEPWNKASLQIGGRIPYRLISRAMVLLLVPLGPEMIPVSSVPSLFLILTNV